MVQAIVVLVEAHPPQNLVHGGEGIQGGLLWVVRRQVVVGLFDRCLREGWYATHMLCRGWGLSGVKQRGGPATLTLTLHQGWDSGWWCSDI